MNTVMNMDTKIEIIKPSYEIIDNMDWDKILLKLEKIMRVCYKSEDLIKPGSADKLIRSIIKRGHESTLEHVSMTVKFICDRGVSHELVRHRHCSFSQESTRYVNYKNKPMQFILPSWIDILDADILTDRSFDIITFDNIISPKLETDVDKWTNGAFESARYYNKLIELGWKPQQARSVLPNSLKN